MTTAISIRNKKASFEYIFIEKYVAGIQLTGTEIKSIRNGKANLSDAYCSLAEGELWIRNMHISEYTEGSYLNHDPKRIRKLLLTKKELRKLQGNVKDKGITIIPLHLFINERGFAKIEIAVAKGKKIHDKRETLKKRDAEREMQQVK